MDAFDRTFQVGWGDLDANGHMRNTAYLDMGGTLRMMYFASQGFPAKEFARLRIGPVIFRDEIDYHRELHLLQDVRVTLELAALSEDAARFRIRNRFLCEDGNPAAIVTSAGGWLDLDKRRLVVPPDHLADTLRRVPRTEDCSVLPVSGEEED